MGGACGEKTRKITLHLPPAPPPTSRRVPSALFAPESDVSPTRGCGVALESPGEAGTRSPERTLNTHA